MHIWVVMARAEDPRSKAEQIKQIVEDAGGTRTHLVIDPHTVEGFDQRHDIISVFTFDHDIAPGEKEDLEGLLGEVQLELLESMVGEDEAEMAEHGESVAQG